MNRLDGQTETKRGTGIVCRCGKSARITVRGQNLCYECFDDFKSSIVDFVGDTERRMRERVREIDRRYITRGRHKPHPEVTR